MVYMIFGEGKYMGKISAEQRRKEIQQFIEEKGIHRINQSALARKYGCGQTQIRRDIERVMSKTPDLNWVAIFNKAQRDFDRTLEIAKKAMDNAKDGKTKSKLAGQISEMLLRKMSFLEKMDQTRS